MPCDCSHLEPTGKEIERKRAARLFRYVLQKMGRTVPDWVEHAAEDYYGKGGARAAERLCETLTAHSERDAIIYNARDKTARDLANWWEEHLEHDRAMKAKQEQNRRHEAAKASALAKLTAEEREAVGL